MTSDARAGLESAFARLVSRGPGAQAGAAFVALGQWPYSGITAAEAATLTRRRSALP